MNPTMIKMYMKILNNDIETLKSAIADKMENERQEIEIKVLKELKIYDLVKLRDELEGQIKDVNIKLKKYEERQYGVKGDGLNMIEREVNKKINNCKYHLLDRAIDDICKRYERELQFCDAKKEVKSIFSQFDAALQEIKKRI